MDAVALLASVRLYFSALEGITVILPLVSRRLRHLDLLVSEEYLKTGPERYPHYTSTKMYREKDDPQSDKYFDPGDLLRHAKEDTQTEETDTQPEEAAEDD